MMETMTSTLVMTPVAITEACWTEWWRRMSTILKMSHLDDGQLLILLVKDETVLTQPQRARTPSECRRHAARTKSPQS